MTSDQLSTFFDAYASGDGIIASLRRAGSSFDEFKADLRTSSALRARFAEAKLDRRESAERVILAAARGEPTPGDLSAAVAYMKLTHDGEGLRLTKARHRLATRPPEPSLSGPLEPNLRLLTDQQWDEYSALYCRIEAGESLSDAEAASFARLVGIASKQPDRVKLGLTYYGDDDGHPPSSPASNGHHNGNGRRNGHG